MIAKIKNDSKEIISLLSGIYSEQHTYQVDFLEAFQLYVANVRLNDKKVSGFLFDKSLRRIQTQKVDEIKDSDQNLIGVIDNKEYTMIREIENGMLSYKLEMVD